MKHAGIAELTGMLRRRDDLRQAGWRSRAIEDAVRVGELHRLRRGWYMAGAQWQQLWPESQHRAHVIAANEDAGADPPVFALASAAVLHGLPLYRAAVPRVHVAVGDADRQTAGTVIRHAGALPDGDVVEVSGIRCTSLVRTVVDVVRMLSPEVAVACADAALGRIGGTRSDYDADAVAAWLAEVDERLAVPGARGVRQARALLEVIDGRAELPLEAVTTLQLNRLGFRRLPLQVPVAGPGGKTYWVDIELPGRRAFYECDGETKYADEAMRSGRTLEEVLRDEKQREDWIRGTTDKRVVRGGSADGASAAALARRLAHFGIALPGKRDRLILPHRPVLYGQ